ncbi:MAG: RNA polymerase sigma factor, partial [Bacteroidota bacterium]
FNLAVVDGYTHEEVAETLGITVGTSKSNLSRARQYLRRLLRNEFEFFD